MKRILLLKWYLTALWLSRRWINKFNHRILFYPLQLVGVDFKKKSQEEMIQLTLAEKGKRFKISLQDIFKNNHYLMNLHPLDVAMLLMLFKEKGSNHPKLNNGYKFLSRMLNLTSFNHIESQFSAKYSRQEMLVITVPDTDSRVCLSVRQFINNQMLYSQIRSSSKLA